MLSVNTLMNCSIGAAVTDDVIVLDDDEPNACYASTVPKRAPVIAPPTVVHSPPTNVSSAPIMQAVSAAGNSAVAPAMILRFPGNGSGQPFIFPAGFAPMQFVNPMGVGNAVCYAVTNAKLNHLYSVT